MGRKTAGWTLQATNRRNLTLEDLDMVKKRELQERKWISSDSSTKPGHKDYVKARIDKTQQNNWCRSYDDKHETINCIIKTNVVN